MAKVLKISDKLTKVSETVNIHFYDNAYMVEVSGRNKNDDWATVKLVCRDLTEVAALLQEVEASPKDS